MNKQRIIYFDYLRIISIFTVVVLHVAAQNWDDLNVNSFEWLVINFYDGIVRWGVPVFVMISGALFLEKEQSIKKLYTKYILRIVIAFAFWSTFYALWNNLIMNNNHSVYGLITEILFGHYHFWFLFMIVGLYIIVPFLRKIVEDKKIAWYFVGISLVGAIIIPQCTEIIGLKSEQISTLFSDLIFKFDFHLALGYSGYFILGYLLNSTEIKKKYRIIIYILGILGLLFTPTLTTVFSLLKQKPIGLFYSNFSLNTFLVSFAVFVFAKRHLNKSILSTHKQKLLFSLSKCSFGVFLLHPFIIELLNKYLNFTAISFNPIFSVPIISLFVFCVSIILSVILNKIPIINKWIV